MENNVRTFMLMAVLTVLFVLVGGQVAGKSGMIVAFLVAGAMNFFAYWFSDKMVLRQYRAQLAEPGSRLYRIVAEQAQKANLPMPKVYIIPEQSPNAFATGRNPQHAAVAATAGILNLLNDDELAGVMAHELAHVKHRDILTGTIAATMAGALAMLGQMARYGTMSRDPNRRQNPLGLMLIAIGVPIAAMIIRAMISRTREYAADEGGATISHKPLGLANALKKISQTVQSVPLSHGNAAHAHMFIINPFLGGLERLFATHPPVEDRIRRLQAMASTNR
ncbi:MAG: zinc metalloprotease HtpX [candidate division KSB1 bacterium]|nr:zinc metalloprotease HtpX [candidate division KSB1 bacterium]MDZ7336203.1 zinc metalloprotease HtpX [candidate division KSB1 bacterium]MDZ7358991.1 zinc metalloprotease HtpX [candidate division KSB1 bacterium]MDZ7402337.1 zinc metalloprotease HtpX [candidate division KSB1 bacterium]